MMNLHLQQLVMQRDTVILPGFGALETQYEPAAFDYVQSKLHPPNKSLTFNENLRLNDGTLIQFVQRRDDTDYETAKLRVEQFINDLRRQLDARETVHVAGIGKFFLDLNDKVHFLPEGQSQLYPATFGLPTISATPVARRDFGPEAPVPAAAPAPAAQTIHLRPSRSARIANLFARALPFILLLAIALVGYTFYQLQEEPNEPFAQNVNQRINTKPGIPDREGGTDVIIDDEPEIPEETADITEDFDTEAPTLRPGYNTDVIVVGTFGKSKNAERMLRRVSEDGYDGWSDRLPNGLRRIGINIAFDSEVEKRERLETMRDRYTRSAYLLSEKDD